MNSCFFVRDPNLKAINIRLPHPNAESLRRGQTPEQLQPTKKRNLWIQIHAPFQTEAQTVTETERVGQGH